MRSTRGLRIATAETSIAGDVGGDGPGLLLLHGFPETRVMWDRTRVHLESDFTVVTIDLRGYGESGPVAVDRGPQSYSKRAMANDAVEVMAELGFEEFFVVGHDRGGRVAYRAALDHPDRVCGLVVLDIMPVDLAWDRADDRFALAFWPWSLLAQAEPLPERLIGGAADAVLAHALSPEWGTPAETFGAEAREIYADQLRDPDRVHAICQEYRAAAGIDREHDATDRRAGRTIDCPTLVLWSAAGPLGSWYEADGGPLPLWRQLAPNAVGRPVDGGHFFPEEHPDETAAALRGFFAES